MKSCRKCNVSKPINKFSKRGKSHHSQCKSCIVEYKRQYYIDNKEKIDERCKLYSGINSENIAKYKREYYDKNKNILLERALVWYEANRSYKIEYQTIYYKDNRESINDWSRNYHSNKRKTNVNYRVERMVRSLISGSIKRSGYSKNSKTEEILGCSFDEFKRHLESKFETWMSWENHGLYNGVLGYGWDIDHIIPISSAINESGVILLNHYTNLQPLCSRVNRDLKRDKLIYE